MALCNAQTSTLFRLALVVGAVVKVALVGASIAAEIAHSAELFEPIAASARHAGELSRTSTSSPALRSFGSFAGHLFAKTTSNALQPEQDPEQHLNSQQQQQQRQQQQQQRQRQQQQQQRRLKNSGDSGQIGDNSRGAEAKSTRASSDRTIVELLAELGPDMRPAGEYRDSIGVTVDIAQQAWRRMHKHALDVVADKVEQSWPMIESALLDANVSSGCLSAAQKTAAGAKNLNAWAIQLLNAWGNFPPAGIFEGTYGDIGSYFGCINVPENEHIKHAHYCTLSFKPILPTRRDYELVIRKEPKELLELFEKSSMSGPLNLEWSNSTAATPIPTNKDAFSELLQHAQYNHYVYYKLGTCFPVDCTPFDVQKLAKLLGQRATLVSGPVKCLSKYPTDYSFAPTGLDCVQNAPNCTVNNQLKISGKDLNNGIYIWKPHITNAQKISLIVFGSITALIIVFTLLDLVCNRWLQLQSLSTMQSRKHRKQQVTQELATPIEGRESGDEFLLDVIDVNNNLSPCGTKKASTTQTPVDLNSNNQSNKPFDLVDSGDIRKCCDHLESSETNKPTETINKRAFILDLFDDLSIITNVKEFFNVSEKQLENDILCINGIRCITMSWIIVTHTMQYNDWSAFARTREVETHLKSLITQPFFNGTYLVDTFFMISGLLTSFSSFNVSKVGARTQPKPTKRSSTTRSLIFGQPQIIGDNQSRQKLCKDFSWRSYLIGRYLRLTPQILLVSLLFIVLPLLTSNGGPHWYTMTGEYSENCSKNWWVNLLHIQAFYRSDEMCNFVCWWVSIDMCYHLVALFVIMSALRFGHKTTVWQLSLLLAMAVAKQAYEHYKQMLPPNLLSTIPQTGAMWSTMTLEFFWTPYAHALPFIMGFYAGYLMGQTTRAKSTKMLNNGTSVNDHQQEAAKSDDKSENKSDGDYEKRENFIKVANNDNSNSNNNNNNNNENNHFNNTHEHWFTRKRVAVGWSLATIGLLSLAYSTYFWVTGSVGYTRTVSTFFYTISPLIWSSSWLWIIIACQYGYGGWLNRALSCRLFIVLGKASYVVYLSHFLVLFTFFGSQNLLLEPTQLLMVYVILGNVCLSMLAGSVLCVIYELPWLKTQRRLMRRIN